MTVVSKSPGLRVNQFVKFEVVLNFGWAQCISDVGAVHLLHEPGEGHKVVLLEIVPCDYVAY